MEAPSPSFPGLVNFCLHGLVELTSSSVSADSYQATNLVSTDPSVRSRGFRVEHFIRPPIQLDYEFQLPLNIAYIIVQPDLTASSEMRLELAGSFHTTLTSSDLLKICPYAVIKGNQTTLIFENKSFKMRDGGRACFSTENILSLPVEGSYMGGSRGSCLDDGMQPVLQPLKYTNVLGRLRHLRVTVNRMSGPKPVAIRSLEVWGYPSNTCSALKLNLLQTSLTAAALKRHSTSSSGVGVKLYRSEKTSPEHSSEQEQEQAVHQQRSLTHNSLHRRSCVDMGLGCNDDSNTKTSCPCSGEDSGRGCGGVLQTVEEEYKQQEPSCRGDVSAVLGVAGCGRCEAPEAFHIKAATSENKKSLKPQQRLGAPHLNGCGHNIQDGEKPAQSGLNNMLPQGKNGNPSPSSELIAHNSDLANDEENSTGSSCGLGPGTAARARQQHQQQQWRRRQQCSEGPTQCVFIEREIPAEFLDKITYDVMHVPMLLPSGYCVDRSTLEKLSNSDALYGRPPTDPFTGIHIHRCCGANVYYDYVSTYVCAVCGCEWVISRYLLVGEGERVSEIHQTWECGVSMILCGERGDWWPLWYAVGLGCWFAIITNFEHVLYR